MEPTHPEIWESARKWGVSDADIYHAYDNAIVYVEREHDGREQLLIIGPARNGALLELIEPLDEPWRIIHAMPLRRTFTRYLP